MNNTLHKSIGTSTSVNNNDSVSLTLTDMPEDMLLMIVQKTSLVDSSEEALKSLGSTCRHLNNICKEAITKITIPASDAFSSTFPKGYPQARSIKIEGNLASPIQWLSKLGQELKKFGHITDLHISSKNFRHDEARVLKQYLQLNSVTYTVEYSDDILANNLPVPDDAIHIGNQIISMPDDPDYPDKETRIRRTFKMAQHNIYA